MDISPLKPENSITAIDKNKKAPDYAEAISGMDSLSRASGGLKLKTS
jgi:hypothetical protein